VETKALRRPTKSRPGAGPTAANRRKAIRHAAGFVVARSARAVFTRLVKNMDAPAEILLSKNNLPIGEFYWIIDGNTEKQI
jgi:hypothetical protein